MNRILVIRYGTIGDSIFASAFLRELRLTEPEAEINLLVDSVSKGVYENCPYINKFYDIKNKYRDIFYYINIFKKHDTVYLLKNDYFFSVIAFLSRVKNRIGFGINRNKFLTTKIPYLEDKHEIDCYLNLLQANGINVHSKETELWIDKTADDNVGKYYKDCTQPKILIQAYSRFSGKNWKDEYWLETIKEISQRTNAKIFLAGGNPEDYKWLKSSDEVEQSNIIDLSGQLTIGESMALISHMDLVVGVDSGLIHAAAALDIDSVLLHGPTSLERWKPRSEKCSIVSLHAWCSPCLLQSNRKHRCSKNKSKCMELLPVSLVVNAIIDKIKNKSTLQDQTL